MNYYFFFNRSMNLSSYLRYHNLKIKTSSFRKDEETKTHTVNCSWYRQMQICKHSLNKKIFLTITPNHEICELYKFSNFKHKKGMFRIPKLKILVITPIQKTNQKKNIFFFYYSLRYGVKNIRRHLLNCFLFSLSLIKTII